MHRPPGVIYSSGKELGLQDCRNIYLPRDILVAYTVVPQYPWKITEGTKIQTAQVPYVNRHSICI